MKKKYVISCIGLLCLVMVGGIGVGFYYFRYVPLHERSKTIEFNDFLEEAKVSTGLIKNNKVEEELNKAGFLDSEIRKLGKKELKFLNICEDVKDLKVKVNFYKYIDDKERLIPYAKNKISGKKIDTRDSVIFSNAMIGVYQNTEANTDMGEYNQIDWKLITVSTWYGTPKKLGREYIGVDIGDADSFDTDSNLYVHYSYEGYNKDGLFKLKKIKDNNINTKIKFYINEYDISYRFYYGRTPKLIAYMDKNDELMGKKYNTILVNKGYDFYKVKDISFISCSSISNSYNTNFTTNELYYYHNVRDLEEKKYGYLFLPPRLDNERNELFSYKNYNEMHIPSTFHGSDMYLEFDFKKECPDMVEKILDEDKKRLKEITG